jgi:hypothetical protein
VKEIWPCFLKYKWCVLWPINSRGMPFFCFGFGSTRVWTQGFTFARQVLLPLESLLQPFFVMSFFSRWGLTNHFPGAGFEPQSSWVARVTGVYHRCPAGSAVFKKDGERRVKFEGGRKPFWYEKTSPCRTPTTESQVKSARCVLKARWPAWLVLEQNEGKENTRRYGREVLGPGGRAWMDLQVLVRTLAFTPRKWGTPVGALWAEGLMWPTFLKDQSTAVK